MLPQVYWAPLYGSWQFAAVPIYAVVIGNAPRSR